MIWQPADATLVTLKVKSTFSDKHENIAPYIDVVFAACDITSDLQAILCDADWKSLRDLSAYDVLKPLVGSQLDTSVTKCVKIDECDVLDNVDVMTQGDDITLINNADNAGVISAVISGNNNDDQIGSAVSSVDHLPNVGTDVSALTPDSLPTEVTSRSEHDILRDEQKADPKHWKSVFVRTEK